MRIVLKDWRTSFEKIKSGIKNPHCVGLIQALENEIIGKMTQTSDYRGTVKVRGAASIDDGTVIATLLDGLYPNEPTGNHVAIYISQSNAGIRVFQQWKGKEPHEATIRFKGGTDPRGPDGRLKMSNDGDFYYIVDT